MSELPLRIIQISDTHLYADPKRELLGIKAQQSFEAVIELMQSEGQIDFIFHSGDLSQDGSQASYIRIAEMLKPFNVPIYCIPGNHDNANVMASVYPLHNISSDKHIVLKSWHIILLNSQKPNAVAGYLDSSQLSYLQHCLQAYPEHRAIIGFHHQPVPVGARWLDNVGLTNADAFWELISAYPKVNTILFGHVHQEYEQVIQGIKCYATPATCFQFACHQDHFGLHHLPPGYRWLHFHEDGRIETGVKRVAHYVGTFDAHAKGY